MSLDSIVSVLASILGFLTRLVPKNLFRRERTRLDRIADNIEIGFREHTAVILGFNQQIPELQIYLQCVNKNKQSVIIDRIIFEVRFGSPSVYGAHVSPIEIEPYETKNSIWLKTKLSGVQRDSINSWYTGAIETERNDRMSVNLYLYCECRLGKFKKEIFEKEYPAKQIKA